jgi:hypothetical protein
LKGRSEIAKRHFSLGKELPQPASIFHEGTARKRLKAPKCKITLCKWTLKRDDGFMKEGSCGSRNKGFRTVAKKVLITHPH